MLDKKELSQVCRKDAGVPFMLNKILIVEDEKHIAEGLRFNLEAENFEVEVAADGRQALQILMDEKQQFDAIVLDVMLPEIDGFTVAKKLREAENFTPILMLNGAKSSAGCFAWF